MKKPYGRMAVICLAVVFAGAKIGKVTPDKMDDLKLVQQMYSAAHDRAVRDVACPWAVQERCVSCHKEVQE